MASLTIVSKSGSNILSTIFRRNSGQQRMAMDRRENGTKGNNPLQSGRNRDNARNPKVNHADMRRHSIESLSPSPDDGVRPEIKAKRMGLFSSFHLRPRSDSTTREKVEADKEKAKRDLAEKDEALARLTFQLKQRETAIRQLEEIVVLQQESMELNRRTLEQEPKQGSGSTTMEEEEMQEVIDHLHKQLKERNEVNASLTTTIKKQQEQLDSLKEKISNSKEEDANKERINEMKGIIQDLQVKLQDKNNTNGALVRSAKMQSETIASLRSELKTLRMKEAQANQESMEELRRKDEIISQLRQELITISQAFTSREGELSGSGEESDDEYYSNSELIGNRTLDVVQEEGSETSFNTH
jgi:chromosome segregation ATPase